MINKEILINFLENEIKKLEKKISNIHERMSYTDDRKEFNKLDTKRYDLACLKDHLETLLSFADENFTVYCPGCNKYYEYYAGALYLKRN